MGSEQPGIGIESAGMDQLSRIAKLNERWHLPGGAEVVTGNGGLPKIRVTTPDATAEIYLHGAQVCSWRPASADEVLFVSDQSRWEDGRAIRGGIPVCFPWFRGKSDDPSAPAHGFVRTKEWNLVSVDAGNDGSVSIVCVTSSDEATRRWWPYEFRLLHRVTLGNTLRMELTAINTGKTGFRFEEALHTYFRVGDAERVQVRGLEGLAYLDNVDGNRQKIQRDILTLAGPLDNAYTGRGAIDIFDPALERVVRTEKSNSSSTIVWNPWREGAAKLADLGDSEWKLMTCVEAGNIIDSAISLDPGAEHTMRSELSLSPA